MSLVYQCDKCKKIITNPADRVRIIGGYTDDHQPVTFEKELCQDCFKNFGRWLDECDNGSINGYQE